MNKKRILFAVVMLVALLANLIAASVPDVHAASGWDARYWDNRRMSGDPVLRRDEKDINYDWGDGAPDAKVPDDEFSVRWKRTENFAAGTYRFSATMDDGMRVWLDDQLIIDSWTDSQVHTVTRDVFVNGGDHNLKVEYYEAGGKAVAKFSWVQIGAPQPGQIVNWRGEYFNNMELRGAPVLVRDDAAISFDWRGGSPGTNVPADKFSARWTRSVPFSAGRYRFTAASDDGVRVWVNGQLLIDAWLDQEADGISKELVLPAGSLPVVVEYYEHGGGARINVSWQQLSGSTTPPSTPPATGAATGTVVSSRLNVRSGPGFQYGVITQLVRGDVVTLKGYRTADEHWAQIATSNGTAGWVSAKSAYLKTSVPVSSLAVWQPGNTGTGGPVVSGQVGVVSNVIYLNVRSAPGLTATVLTTIPGGQLLELLGRDASAYWLKVRLPNGVVGWVSAKYIATDSSVSALPLMS